MVGKFLIASDRGGPYFQSEHLSRGLALADFDNDGRVDVAIANVNEPYAIMRNVSSDKNHWVGVSLEGIDYADLVGTRILLTAGGRTQTRFVKGGGSYTSAPDKRLVFGLGTESTISKSRRREVRARDVTWRVVGAHSSPCRGGAGPKSHRADGRSIS